MAGSLGFASRLGGRGSVTAEQAAAQMYSNGIVSGFVVSPATPTANMTVTVGGVAGTPDVMVATNAVGNNVFLKNRNTDAFTLSMTAPASNSVIYAIVGFTDDLSVATTDATSISDNPSKCGLIAVAGTSAASPVAPSDAQIRTAITSAGFTGSQAAYGVLGYVTLASTTTTITAPNISQVGCTTPLSVAKINGGTTDGVLLTDASGNVTGGKVTADKVDSTSLWGTAARNYISTSQTTAIQTYTDLATVQSVTVTIRQGGKLLVGISCADIQNTAQHSQAWISFDLSGANTVAAGSSTIEAKFQAYVNNGAGSVSATALLTGLSAGSTTVTMKFRASANTATFAGRLLWALPLV